MARAKLIVTAAAVLLLAQLHCVTACAAELCSSDSGRAESVPPCHQHQHPTPDPNRRSCSFQRVMSAVTTPDAQHFEMPVLFVLGLAPARPATLRPADTVTRTFDFSDGSPPGAAGISSFILRI